jgi:hypothetical protein
MVLLSKPFNHHKGTKKTDEFDLLSSQRDLGYR